MPRLSTRARTDLPTPRLDFRDIARPAGLTAANVYGGVERKRFILEMTGNGAAIFDYDNDGSRDVLLVSGRRLEPASAPPSAPLRLYRNESGAAGVRFREQAAGFSTAPAWNQGVCAGDYDNDGHTDVLVTRFGANVLYRNLGGRFLDTTAALGLPTAGERWASSCAFLDFDRDGWLDLFVSNYVVFDPRRSEAPGASPFCSWHGLAVFCGPRGFPTGQNVLYRSDRGRRFHDVSAAAGIALKDSHYGLGATVSDFDADGWPDIYVACDSTPSILYINRRDGTFADLAVPAGVAYGEAGQEQGGMGTAAGDYDNDGRMDLVKTNFFDETPSLYRNEGERFFTDTTYIAGLGLYTHYVGWGVQFLDADHDGWRDILMANGHIYPELAARQHAAVPASARTAQVTPAQPQPPRPQPGPAPPPSVAAGALAPASGGARETYRQPKLLYWNLRNGAFRDVTAAAGPGISLATVARGLATGDLDGDGALEALIVNMNEPPVLLKNHAPAANAVILDLTGTRSNRSAIGARVAAAAGDRVWVDEVRSGSSYASQSDFRLHFGLGEAPQLDRIEVHWPSGRVEKLGPAPANHVLAIREGEGITARTPFRRAAPR